MRRILINLAFFLFVNIGFMEGQQDATLFFMHSTPQANFVNPAVRNDCKWMLGLPIISSVHIEYGNPEFTTLQVLKKQPDNTYVFDGNEVLHSLGKTNYLTSEIHANLFFLSFWKNDNFFTISVNEKADLFVTYPRDAFAMVWNGNTQFVDKTANLNHTGIFFNYRREYAFGIAKEATPGLVWGVRGKFLFGKLNVSTQKSNLSLYTFPNTYHLRAISDWQLNTSLPMMVTADANNVFQSASYNGSVGSILLNNSNIGLAFDLGFTEKLDNNVTISGSILDLGIIRWFSDSHSFAQHVNEVYLGQSDTSRHVGNLLNTLKYDFGIYTLPNSYFSFLIPTYYFGGTYNFTPSFNVGAVTSGKISRYRITSGVTLSANKTFKERMSLSLSYSYLYKSFNNIGAGIKLGKSPVQFFAVSDNILGLIKPLDTKNINVRFGLQFNFGCFREEKIDNCGCEWLKKANKSEERRQRLLRSKQKI